MTYLCAHLALDQRGAVDQNIVQIINIFLGGLEWKEYYKIISNCAFMTTLINKTSFIEMLDDDRSIDLFKMMNFSE